MNEADIFYRAIQEPDPEKRLRLVIELCDDDSFLKDRVMKLLEAHGHPETFFADPARIEPDPDISTAGQGRPVVSSGMTIGPYKLLQQIGEGGMGLVFMADQVTPVKRRVALKVIKPGMDSRQVIARFEAERQALAMMDHPNIAKVLDAGTTDNGYPYFVMELVNGMPLTEYCDNEKMPTEERLKLFVAVCLAVQHAHQKGIIHRDLKPGNILVAEYDGQPVPKVIDFGVAKATGAQLTDKTLFTQFGQVIGTLEYMSPEQARRNQLDVDTRSDIYSLGIVLYKLLTGETPFDEQRFRNAAFEEMLNIIRDEEPPKPSLRIGSSQSLEQIAECRSVEAARLSSMVRGDLDWIVLKSLEKDRNRRYQSTGELADDVTRHLNQLPIRARPRSWRDRVSKFTRRNRAAIMKSLVVSLGFLMIGMAVGNRISRRSTDRQARTDRLEEAISAVEFSLVRAESSILGDSSHWENTLSHLNRVDDIVREGDVDSKTRKRADLLVKEVEIKNDKRRIAEQIEEIVIQGATIPDLESWQRMEKQMREFFRQHGYDLDTEDPAEIGKRIQALVSRDPDWSALWADLLELWIGTRGQMATIGGPPLTAAIMQPWADAIYIADHDPIRTGIRKFVCTPPRDRKTLDALIQNMDLTTLRPRTLSWLGTCYSMVGATEKVDEIFEIALQSYPHDLMLTFDYAYTLHSEKRYQQATRMYNRCLAVRNDVPGIWKSLALSLSALGEESESRNALERAALLEAR